MTTMVKIRTARRQHDCSRCTAPIEPGERYQHWTCTPWDDEVNQGPHWLTAKVHLGCYEVHLRPDATPLAVRAVGE
jgi:hypothetical protein